jgi:DNA repair exonuclease SbcCD ATPase subunit
MSWKFGLHSSTHSRTDTSVDGRSNHSQASSQRAPVLLDEELDGSQSRSDLENVIRDQDVNITVLEKSRQEKQQELAALQKELYEERLLQMKDSILHQIETERLQRQTKAVKELLAALEKDMQDKDAIHEYANLIKGVAPSKFTFGVLAGLN